MPEVAAVAPALTTDKPVAQTSLDTYQPTDLTVRFRRWTAFQSTAYLRGQEAGFSRAQVAEMQRRGLPIEIVIPVERQERVGRSVTK